MYIYFKQLIYVRLVEEKVLKSNTNTATSYNLKQNLIHTINFGATKERDD